MLGSKEGRALALCATLLLLAVTTAAGGADAVEASDSSAAGVAIDLNHATAQQLTAIPGIGEAMAQRIVDWREEHGPFRRVEDLMKVKGIGEKSLEKMRPHVAVGKTG